ncbi:MAG TPA: hypothetical protein VKA85_02655 [Candidatus Limnocylindrales bacterium]|nr:hypothetical protein [Candidatus Limnocylindrales bacterium]
MPRRVTLPPALIAAIAAVAAVMALSWTAAEGGRGLDASDFRTVVIVAVAVWLGVRILHRAAA